MHYKFYLKTILILLIPSFCWADDIYDKCIKQSDGTNVAWGECGGALLQRLDKRLNAVWKDAYGKMPSEESKKSLLEEQRLWIAYKEKSCLFYTNGDFGREGQVLHYPNCRAFIIEQRIKELESIIGFQ